MNTPAPFATTRSRFLPTDFNPARPVAVIAGRGLYPQLTVRALRHAGVPVRLIAFVDETAPDLVDTFPTAERETIKVGQLGHLLKALRSFEAGAAIMAGQIRPRRLFEGLHPDWKAIAILASLKERNAATIFGAIAKEMENIGVHLLDARAFLDHQLAEVGVMTGGRRQVDEETLAFGVRLAREMARLDVGQGVVVSGGTVIAVEAFEGTDAMLRRAGQLGAKDPLFVKTPKPDQDFRFDVPVFGRSTIAVMREAGITQAALAAESTLILEKDIALAEARIAGIQLLGYENPA
jgi:UDP-2,3-diacylglucosamine hydrolase